MNTQDAYKLVTDILDEVVDGPRAEARDLAASLVGLCQSGGQEGLGEARRRIAGRGSDELLEMIRYLTARFHLLNNAEKANIARINRQRECMESFEHPRAESIAEGLLAVKRLGLDGAQSTQLLARLDIQPTLTAHPTEARRRSVQLKLREVSELLRAGEDRKSTPAERRRVESRLRQLVTTMLLTDEVRARRLGVYDEVRNGLHFLTSVIWDSIPTLARDVVEGLRGVHGEGSARMSIADLPPLLRYRTWIGGDRDGNPRVTSDVTRRTLEMLGRAAREKVGQSLEELRQELSVSERRCEIPAALRRAIERDAAFDTPDADLMAHTQHEPFRRRALQLQARVSRDRSYGAAALLADLEEIRVALQAVGLRAAADEGPLAELILRVRVFGLHMATLDLRQHSGVHERVVAELLRVGGAHEGYESLGEDARLEILRRELASPRPLLPPGGVVTEEAAESLRLLRIVAEARATEPDAVRGYVVSMTHSVSDLLEVLLLLKEAGLFRIERGRAISGLDVIPLLETIDDLRRGPALLKALFAEPVYRLQLEARGEVEAAEGGRFQEVMLGYSDSNKDGGFLMANVALREAQEAICTACRDSGVEFRLFHGRGGSVGRGGGRANRAILSMPTAAQNGRIRFTEQGEVISFRYGVPAIARRHLEQIVSAMIVSARQGGVVGEATLREAPKAAAPLMDRLSERSMAAYRALIEDPDFWPWFVAVSPVRHIGGLPIASRPVARTGGEITFDTLRAIPWVFSWTQMRYLAPSWYGLGAALTGLHQEELEACREAHRAWPFFQTVLNNAQREMARARLEIARFYAAEHPSGERMHGLLAADFNAARGAIAAITGEASLLAGEPVIARAIEARNPWTDLLNLSQVELLRRARDAEDPEEAERLRPAIFASINALAAAMQSTG